MSDTLNKKTFEEQLNSIKLPRIGDIIEGAVIGSGRSSVFVDLGPVGSGVIYGREFYEAKDIIKKLKVGDKVFAKIVDLENEEGYIELSLREASAALTWEDLRQKKDKGENMTIKVLKANKGGLMAEISGIQGFLPVSQLSQEHYPRVEDADASKILRELQKFIGKDLEVKILDLDQKEGKLIFSEKSKDLEKTKEILKNYKVGDIVEGEVTGVVDFGVFVRFPYVAASEGGEPRPTSGAGSEEKAVSENPPADLLEGLIHISELDWKIIENPAEIVKVGEKVKAKIIGISDAKIFLSLKALKEDPWQKVENLYKKGDVIKGKVTKFNPFGAFVQIDTGDSEAKIQGLCHISEFGNSAKMEETLKIGESYDFEILLIDAKEHKMSLRLADKK